MLADFVDGRIVLDGVQYRDRDSVRQLSGARFVDDQWRLPVSWPAVKVLRAIFGDRLEISEALKACCWREFEDRVGPATEWRSRAIDPQAEAPGDPRLYPYQRTGVQFLAAAHGAILADEMGTGKTAQAIALLEAQGAWPALIIAPKSAKAGWVREFKKWAPHRTVVSVGGSAVKRRQLLAEPADCFIIHWDALRLHSRLAPYSSTRLTDDEKTPKELNQPWSAVIADEAHRAVNPKAKQTRALWAIGDGAVSDAVKVAMTGTPIADSPDDLWSLLRFVAPHEWPSRTKYIDRWCLTRWNAFGGIEVAGLNPHLSDEFHELVDVRLLRRPKSLVLPWLPEKTYERRDVEMSPKQAKAYREFEKGMVAELDSGTGLALDTLSQLTRLSQLASASVDLQEDGSIRMCVPSSKVDALVELLEDMGNEPLVVFAQSRQLIELAAERLVKEKVSFSKIVGGQSELVRSMAEEDFQQGRVRVILLTLGAGSEALTLTAASTTCFMQRSWSLIENRQAENRTHRPGQDADKVTIVDLVAPDTIEEDQHDALADKGDRLEEIVRDRQLLRGLLR